MPQDIQPPRDNAPFHSGERAAQQKAEVRDRTEAVGRRAIRDHMPDQHREFFATLPMIFAGHVDAQGWPWASVLYGGMGFITAPDAHHLAVQVLPTPGDPLGAALREGLALGMVGMGLHNRRRNRVNGQVVAQTPAGFTLAVTQSFGNCPQYIKTRTSTPRMAPTPCAETFTQMDEDAHELIGTAETFFVASQSAAKDLTSPTGGADMSHRGGRPGFVKVDGDLLTVPDFAGNNFFNTLGNMMANPRAGLLFVDYVTGHVLMLSGTTEILWEGRRCGVLPGLNACGGCRCTRGCGCVTPYPCAGRMARPHPIWNTPGHGATPRQTRHLRRTKRGSVTVRDAMVGRQCSNTWTPP